MGKDVATSSSGSGGYEPLLAPPSEAPSGDEFRDDVSALSPELGGVYHNGPRAVR